MERVSLLNIFGIFAKIGATTIGGGYMIIPAIEAEMKRRGWIPEEELPDIVALSQTAPGLLAVNMSIFAGYRLRGVKGSIAATLGSILPPFLIILAVAMVFSGLQDHPLVVAAFKGIRPVVVALIAAPTVRMAEKNCLKWWAWAIAFLTAVAVALLKVSPIYILLSLIVIATALAALKEGRRR